MRFAPADVETFFATERELKELAAYLQPFFFESPPDLELKGWRGLLQSLGIARRFKGITRDQMSAMTRFMTGSLGEFLDRRFQSDKLKRLILSNSLYGKHGGPYQPGTAMGLLFHLLNGGEDNLQGFQGHVIGGMGAISGALLQALVDWAPEGPLEAGPCAARNIAVLRFLERYDFSVGMVTYTYHWWREGSGNRD